MDEEAIMEKPVATTLLLARTPSVSPARRTLIGPACMRLMSPSRLALSGVAVRSLSAVKTASTIAVAIVAVLATLASLPVASAAAPARAGRTLSPQAQAVSQPQAKPMPAPPEAKLPDTQAGRIAGEFLNAFNSGTDKDFLEFFKRNAGEAALKRRTDAERLATNRQMKDRLGRLAARSVESAGDVGIILLAETEKAGWVRLEFLLEAAAPHKLDAIRIDEADAPPPPGSPSGAAPPLPANKLRVYLDEFVSRAEGFGFAGGVLFAKDGEVVLERGCGLADRARGIPVSSGTAFDIGSNTKDFTKMAVLQLADAGKLKLDDPLAKFFDGVPPDKAAITVAQLMNHTAGFPLYSGPDDEVLTRDDFLKRILAAKLVAEPGREENYSNPGYSLLAAIIEKVTGGSWERYASEHIFKPAGMTETGYALPKWKPGQIAHAYQDGRDTGSTFDYPHAADGPYWNLRGNGGTLSTLGDMYKFHLALAGEKLLKKESKEKLFPQSAPVALVGGNGVHFFIYHRDPAAGLAVLVASTDAAMRAMDMDRALAAIARGGEIALPPAVVNLVPEAVDKLAGTYELPSGGKFTITSLKDRLAVVADGQEATGLLAGLGPEGAAVAEAFNARALAIADASARGDYGPLAEAFGGRVDPGELKARNEKIRQEREARLGAFKGVRVMGTVPATQPRGPRRTMAPGETVTVVALEYERGTAYARLVWGEEGLVGRDPDLSAPPATEFRPVSETGFASYSLAAGSGNEIRFELGPDGQVAGLSFGEGALRAIARLIR
jgi:CubicO group peptidase (beta-lactamase class C family)